jgi:hypothetical protein
MPVYIVHHVPLLLLGVAVLTLAIPVWLKVVLIFVGAATVLLAAYRWLIRPWPPMRLLMGMSARTPNTTPASQPAPTV